MATPIDVGDAEAGRAVVGGGVLPRCCAIFAQMKRIPPTNNTTRMAPVTVRDAGKTRRDLLDAPISPSTEGVTLYRFAACGRNLTPKTVLPHSAIHAPPDDPRHHDPFDRPRRQTERLTGGQEHLQPVGLCAQQGTPPPPGRFEAALPSAGEFGADVVGHQRVPAIAGGAAKWVGGRDVADREDTGMPGYAQL